MMCRHSHQLIGKQLITVTVSILITVPLEVCYYDISTSGIELMCSLPSINVHFSNIILSVICPDYLETTKTDSVQQT